MGEPAPRSSWYAMLGSRRGAGRLQRDARRKPGCRRTVSRERTQGRKRSSPMIRDRKRTFSAGCTQVSPPALFATILLALLMATPALTQTAFYQPTPYPPNVTTGVHIWDGWVTSVFYGKNFIQDETLQFGGWADIYRAYLRMDTLGLPARVTKATLVLTPFPKNDGSTPTAATLFIVAGPWSP